MISILVHCNTLIPSRKVNWYSDTEVVTLTYGNGGCGVDEVITRLFHYQIIRWFRCLFRWNWGKREWDKPLKTRTYQCQTDSDFCWTLSLYDFEFTWYGKFRTAFLGAFKNLKIFPFSQYFSTVVFVWRRLQNETQSDTSEMFTLFWTVISSDTKRARGESYLNIATTLQELRWQWTLFRNFCRGSLL